RELQRIADLDFETRRDLHLEGDDAVTHVGDVAAGQGGRREERQRSPHGASGAGVLAMSRSAVSAWRTQRSASAPLGGRERKARRGWAPCAVSPRLRSRNATP